MSHAAPATAGVCRPWGAGASIAWGILAVALWLGSQALAGDFLLDTVFAEAAKGDLATNAPFVAALTIGGAFVPLAVIALAVWTARCSLAGYLGLRLPDRRYLLMGLAALAVMIPAVDLFSWLAGYAVTPQFVIDIYRSGRDSGALIFLAIALAVAAPVVEETVFRGFLLPGLAQSVLGAWGAILVSSAAWAALHVQYQPFYLLQIVVLGVAFSWLRLKSGSTTLTIILHGLLNLVALVQAGVIAEWFS